MNDLIQKIEKKYDHLISDIATPVFIVKLPEGSILLSNLAVEDLLGYEREEIKSTEFYKFFEKEDQNRLINLFQSDIYLEKGTEYNLRFIKKSRKKIFADITFQLQELETQKISFITIHDITQLKKTEKELIKTNALLQEKMEIIEKQNEDLIQVDKAKTKFLSLITHELKTPVSAMMGISELISSDPETKTEYQEMLQMACIEGNQLLQLVENILDFMNLQTGKLTLQLTEEKFISLFQILQTSIDSIKALAKEKNIQLHFIENTEFIENNENTENTECFLIDRERCLQVFNKILDNSLKFNKPEGNVYISIRNNENYLEIIIQDTGIGISPENIAKVFRGFEISADIRTHKRGSGLGLPISKHLMEAMNGKLSIESKENLETIVTLTFPICKKAVCKKDES